MMLVYKILVIYGLIKKKKSTFRIYDKTIADVTVQITLFFCACHDSRCLSFLSDATITCPEKAAIKLPSNWSL